jgi:putative addiction module killer protein
MIEIRQTRIFATWMAKLRDARARGRMAARIDRLAHGNPGDAKSVGQSVIEMRIDYEPGYRVYCVRRRATLWVLLCGGDKSTQDEDVIIAKRLAAELEE